MANSLVREDTVCGIINIKDKLWKGKAASGGVGDECTALMSSECSYIDNKGECNLGTCSTSINEMSLFHSHCSVVPIPMAGT